MTYPATIAAGVQRELIVRKSRFLTRVEPVTSVAEAEAVTAAARKHHWDARHHCVAMVLGLQADQARSSDDGEPSGTAGIPMLEVLRRRKLTDLVAVVSRYFGGVKLGAGGLIRAYSTAVSDALDTAPLVRRVLLTQLTVDVPHADVGRYENVLRDWVARSGARMGETTYAACASIEVWTPAHSLADAHALIAAASAGALSPVVGRERITDVPD